MVNRRFFVALILVFCSLIAAHAETLPELSRAFWQWRAVEQPFTNDDIPRIDRPTGFRVDWSQKTIALRLMQLATYESRWKALAPPAGSPIPDQVDYRLTGAAIARVRWELAIEQNWKRDPGFYVDQTLGSVYVLLLPPPPFSAARQTEIVARMKRIPETLQAARENLTDMRQPFVQLAIDSLDQLPERMDASLAALSPELTPANAVELKAAAGTAVAALTVYRAWLRTELPKARKETAIGRENYLWFLHNVALVSYSPEEMLALSRQEWSRAVAFESYEQSRLAKEPPQAIFPSADAQIAAERADEESIRAFLTDRKILTVPDWLQHYRNRLLPAYLAPLEDLGVTDDLTGPDRLGEDGTSYIRTPSLSLGYFNLSTAKDPRPIVVHEGVPGHYFQLCLGWHNPDPIRRHYYDSGANEGIGFYAEEMMLQAGLFEDRPRTREIIDSFMRLRALRVEVDIKLALGEFTLQQAADYLEATVPMDKHTALDEAAMFSSTPGQAITYQIGKIQITQLLADARRRQGEKFSLLAFHDFVWNNGNVPISLQRWELLGDPSQVPALKH
jgi:uncharacterized protein (DUF885 family)